MWLNYKNCSDFYIFFTLVLRRGDGHVGVARWFSSLYGILLSLWQTVAFLTCKMIFKITRKWQTLYFLDCSERDQKCIHLSSLTAVAWLLPLSIWYLLVDIFPFFSFSFSFPELYFICSCEGLLVFLCLWKHVWTRVLLHWFWRTSRPFHI